MKALRITALIGSVLCIAVLVSPAVASGPALSSAVVPVAETPSVTAIGIGLVQSGVSDPLAIGQTLYIGVQSTADAAGLQSAADELVAKLDTIKAALVKSGVPADGIRMTGFSVNPLYGPTKPTVERNQPPPVTSLTLGGSLMADVSSIRMLLAAMNAATESGATSVNANAGKGGAPYGTIQPSAADLAKVTAAAVANARANAEALAAASGRKLGAIRSISSQQPPSSACCPPTFGWLVQVTVTFDFAP